MLFRPIPRPANGFTLIEMMVALFIFSLLSVAAILLLRGAVDANAGTSERLNDMAVMQRFLSLVEADLSQAIARPYRDERGERRGAFVGAVDGNAETLLSFTRGGLSNLDGRARSSLQRIAYRIRDGQIERISFSQPDGGAASEPVALLSGVSAMRVRYRDVRGQWVAGWRAERLADIPRAMEWRFTYQGREFRQLFLVGTGYL